MYYLPELTFRVLTGYNNKDAQCNSCNIVSCMKGGLTDDRGQRGRKSERAVEEVSHVSQDMNFSRTSRKRAADIELFRAIAATIAVTIPLLSRSQQRRHLEIEEGMSRRARERTI